VKRYWEIIGDNLSKAGWSWGCVATVDREGRTIWIADAHRDDGKRFVARAEEKLTAFVTVVCLVASTVGSSPRFLCAVGYDWRVNARVSRNGNAGHLIAQSGRHRWESTEKSGGHLAKSGRTVTSCPISSKVMLLSFDRTRGD
jgi:hypothetical protein